MSEAGQVSVIIVSYNTKDLLRRCIESIDPACEVIVVDNASSDGSLDMLKEFHSVLVISNLENVGFGAANNQGLDVATRPLLLLLNSDAYAIPGAIYELASVFEDDGIVAAGGTLMNPDGSLQQSCANELTLWAVVCEQLWLEKIFARSRLFNPYWTTRRLVAQGPGPYPVAQVMGACLMMRKVERFDERFFLYCEDTELCKRLSRHGRILYVPAAKFYHTLGSSSRTMRWKGVAFYNCGKELYFRIHSGSFSAVICVLLDRFGAIFRFLYWTLMWMGSAGMNRRMVGFWKILTAPLTYDGVKGK